MIQKLTEEDYARAARAIGTDVAAVKAVVEVESSGSGFLPDGRPKILFEAHWFAKFTNGAYNRSHPNISSPRWNRALYKGGAREYPRLEEAKKLDASAALKSASWGLFQIMGFNHKLCGFVSVEDFVSAMKASEGRQLDAFVGFIESKKLNAFLIKKDWASFAYRYNGAGYKQNKYDTKMAAAYARHAASGGQGAPAPAGATYTVKGGDTLGLIARKYFRGTLDELLELNPEITNPNAIRVGQVIKLD